MDVRADSGVACSECGAADLREARVRSAFWEGEQLVVVEGIRALVCPACGEQYFDDEAAIRLDLLRGAGFPAKMAIAELRVLVFSLERAEHPEP